MTVREIAKQLGVSPATVSIVLNGRPGVSDATRARVQAALEQNGYRPEKQVKKDRKDRKKQVLVLKYVVDGFLVEENQGFVGMIIDSISETLHRTGYTMSMTTAKNEISDVLRGIEYDALSGMILVASELPRRMYAELKSIPVPLVVVDNLMPDYSFCCVGINNAENVQLALRYCRECGFRTIGYLKSSFWAENFESRSEAYRFYTKKLGLKSIAEFRLMPTLMGAFEDMTAVLKKDGLSAIPDCFFADNDTIALGAMRALRKAGIRTPENVAVIGFDDIPYSAVNAPTLTTIRVQRDLIGRETVYQLIHQIENPGFAAAKTTFTGELVVRTSMKKTGIK